MHITSRNDDVERSVASSVSNNNMEIKPGNGDAKETFAGSALGNDNTGHEADAEVLALKDVDPALDMKMHLVNNVSKGFDRPSKDFC
jgi:hypothetical protein